MGDPSEPPMLVLVTSIRELLLGGYWMGIKNGIRTFSQRTFSHYLQGGHLANTQKFISYMYMYVVIFLSLCMLCQYYVLFMDVANIGLSLDQMLAT